MFVGKPEISQNEEDQKIRCIPHASDAEFSELVAESKIIISGAGYTSVMDLRAMGRGAYLIPTPGQSEQEYLCEHLSGSWGFQPFEWDKGSIQESPITQAIKNNQEECAKALSDLLK